MKIKTGKCLDCGVDSIEQPLIAKRCKTHYWQHRANVSSDKAKNNVAKYEDRYAQQKALDLWFAARIKEMPPRCQECDGYLNRYAPWGCKAYIAHVLGKAIYTSVATHPDNCIYLCIQCHTNYDNWGEDKVQQMNIYSIVLDKLFLLSKYLQHDEARRLPRFFTEHVRESPC